MGTGRLKAVTGQGTFGYARGLIAPKWTVRDRKGLKEINRARNFWGFMQALDLVG